MAQIKALTNVKDFKTNRLRDPNAKRKSKQAFAFQYDDRADAATILLVEPQNTIIVHYLDDFVGFLYEENSLEIVGLRIDDFEEYFLPAHQPVQNLWMSVHRKEIKDFGELVFVFQRTVAREVVKATRNILGEPGEQIEALVEMAA